MTIECNQFIFGFHPQKRREVRAQLSGHSLIGSQARQGMFDLHAAAKPFHVFGPVGPLDPSPSGIRLPPLVQSIAIGVCPRGHWYGSFSSPGPEATRRRGSLVQRIVILRERLWSVKRIMIITVIGIFYQ